MIFFEPSCLVSVLCYLFSMKHKHGEQKLGSCVTMANDPLCMGSSSLEPSLLSDNIFCEWNLNLLCLLYQASGKLMILDQLLQKLHNSGHRVLLFAQMTHTLDILQVSCIVSKDFHISLTKLDKLVVNLSFIPKA